MNLKVSFHEAAEGELNEAADFYDLASSELAVFSSMKFSEQLEESPSLQKQPRSCAGGLEENLQLNFHIR